MSIRAHRALLAAFAILTAASPFASASAQPRDLAGLFGARETAWGVHLSPDGSRISYLTPFGARGSALVVADVATGQTKTVLTNDDSLLRLSWCRWAKVDRLVCSVYGIADLGSVELGFTRMLSVDAAGKDTRQIGQRTNGRTLGINQSSGDIISWLPDTPDDVLMQIEELPEVTIGTRLASSAEGLAPSRVNIRTGSRRRIGKAYREGAELYADAQGEVRLLAVIDQTATGMLGKKKRYLYRTKNSSDWRPLAESDLTANLNLTIDGFDDTGDWVYVFKPKDGRQALYRYAVDGSGRQELVYSHPEVDVDGVLRIGKYGRPVAAEYTSDSNEVEFFDPALAKLSASLSKALPGSPSVAILDESWDGKRKLVYAGSDVDPGRYYLFDTNTKELAELLPVRVGMDALKHGTMKPVTYAARDGTRIPGYLTLPAGREAKNLPTIVMPHGGPAARDQWGFDWLAQYFAQLGYAVLQPNFRGSSGYGEAWYAKNGVRSWQTAIGDINDGARWLVAQGIADPKRTGIVGWSYGGYAALQANVLDDGLYKAAVAIAPVTDWNLIKEEAYQFTNFLLVADYVGSGPHLKAGSPAVNADRIKAPVLLFHGDRDLNVGVRHSQRMKDALEAAGKPTELVVYKGLDHSLPDSGARTDMLRRAAAFLGQHLGL